MNYSPTNPNESFIASRASICSLCGIYKVFARSDQIVNVWFRHGNRVCTMGSSSTPVCLSYSTQTVETCPPISTSRSLPTPKKMLGIGGEYKQTVQTHCGSGETVTTRLSAIHTRGGHNVIRNFIVAVTLVLKVRSSCDLIRQC